MKKLTALKCFKNFILAGFSYLLIEFIDMMLPGWLYSIMMHCVNGGSLMDLLAEEKPRIEQQPDPRRSIKTYTVVKSKVAFDFNPN